MSTKKAVDKRFKVHTVYLTDAGVRVPGASTIAGMLDKPGLVHAAWKLGVEGKDYKKVWGQSADIGTIAHDMIECFIKGNEFDPSPYIADDVVKATNAYNGFRAFEAQLPRYRTVLSEGLIMLDGFCAKNVSEAHRYGGTIDWVIEIIETGELWYFDFKSSKAIYEEHKYQTAAYFNLFHENNPEKKLSKVYLLHLGKEDGTFKDHILDRQDIENMWAIFWYLLQIYWLRK